MGYLTFEGLRRSGTYMARALEDVGLDVLATQMQEASTKAYDMDSECLDDYYNLMIAIKRAIRKDVDKAWRKSLRKSLRQFKMQYRLMECRGYKVIPQDFNYMHMRDHSCPDCGKMLFTYHVSRIVHAESDEAEWYDFSTYDGEERGNMEFVWDEFYCKACGLRLSVQALKDFEIEHGLR